MAELKENDSVIVIDRNHERFDQTGTVVAVPFTIPTRCLVDFGVEGQPIPLEIESDQLELKNPSQNRR